MSDGHTIFVDVDPNAPHDEDCNFWHGGTCDCNEEMRAARDREHCHECDYVNSYSGSARCNCRGHCICERLEDCPCIGRLEPVTCGKSIGRPSCDYCGWPLKSCGLGL